MDYISAVQAAEKWGISDRRVRILCQQGKIPGVIRQGRSYWIPPDAEKPADGRHFRYNRNNSYESEQYPEAEFLRNELNRFLTEGERQRLMDEFLIEYIYDSNALAGDTLSLRETALVLEGATIEKRTLAEHLKVIGHRDAFLYVQALAENKAAFSQRVIRQLHGLVLMDRREDRGAYRRIPLRILGGEHEPPDPGQIPEQMEELVREFSENRQLHPIERAALFHLKFEAIHPFVDGNGRTGRLLLNLLLMQEGYPPVNLKNSDRSRYYAAFDAYNRDGDVNSMCLLILESMKGSHLCAVAGRLNNLRRDHSPAHGEADLQGGNHS